jgi:HK97 family phage major capsid protein
MPTAIDSLEKLSEHVKNVTLPLITQHMKDEGGAIIAEQVKEAVTKRYEDMKKELTAEPPWLEAIKGKQESHFKGKKEREKGEAAGRFMRALVKLNIDRKSSEPENVQAQLKAWGDDDIAEVVEKDAARRKAMAVTSATDGGFLVPEQFSQDVIELLRPQSVVRSMVGRTLPMPVGSINIPKITDGSTAYYIGENTNATKSQLKTGNLKLTWKKLVTLVPLSNDLARYSSPGADAIVRNDMIRSMAQRENQAFLRDDGTNAGPKGLRYWIHPSNLIDVINATFTTQTVATDLGRCILQLINNNVPLSKPGWLFAPRTWNYLRMLQTTTGAFIYQAEMNSGLLLGYPFRWSTQIPTNLSDHGRTTNGGETEIYFADFDDVVIGEAMSLRVDASQEASYMEGSSLVSAFSQDQTVIRAITEHDFGVRRDVSVMVMNGVCWA